MLRNHVVKLKNELSELELLQERKKILLHTLNLESSRDLSWVKICNILYPINVEKAIIKILDYIEKNTVNKYYEIYEKVENIDEGSEFWNCDILWIGGIVEILYEFYKKDVDSIVEKMKVVHKENVQWDIDKVFLEAVKK